MRRLAAVLLALVAVLGMAAVAAQPAAADGPIGTGVETACDVTQSASPIGIITNIVTSGAGYDMCDKLGSKVDAEVKEAWKSVWDSVLGDVINSGIDVTKWVIKKVLIVSLLGPSVDLEATGLFGADATLAGMLTWLGLVIASAGAMWQIGKMAVTGQSKHVGRAMLGWVENTILSAVGVGLIATLLIAGDALTTGLVNATFKDDGEAYEQIVKVMVPVAINNPVTALSVVLVLLVIGFVQLIMVFLRQAAIPIQCLLLPVAAGGRVGGDATRQWAPRLITSILVVIAYKPILAVIICVGFSEFGHAGTLAEWLRGVATFILAILAPGPLTRIFAPFGEAVGAGLASGGVGGALGSAAGFIGGRGKDGNDGSDGAGAQPTTAVEHAALVEQSMGRQRGGGSGGDGEAGQDAQAQAARNEAGRVPSQPGAADGAASGTGTGAAGGVGTTGGQTGTSAAAGTTGTAGTAAGGAGIAIQVLDGVNNQVQNASGQIGSGGNSS